VYILLETDLFSLQRRVGLKLLDKLLILFETSSNDSLIINFPVVQLHQEEQIKRELRKKRKQDKRRKIKEDKKGSSKGK
jgi:hypothetical protein